MNRTLAVLVLAAFPVVLLILFVAAADAHPPGIAEREFALHYLTRGVGLFIAGVAALGLLVCGVAGAAWERQVSLVLPMLGGTLLIGVHWAPVLALALVALALIFRGVFPRPAQPREGAGL